MRARSDIRARPVSLALLTVLVGVIGAIAITALAGARRIDSAYPRYRAASREPEAIVLSCPDGQLAPQVGLGAVQRLPQVASSAVVSFVLANVTDAQGRPLLYRVQDLETTVVAPRASADTHVVRPWLLAGRLPVAVDEVAIGYGSTSARRPALGETINVSIPSQSGVDETGQISPDPDKLLNYRVRVTGRVLMPGELPGDQGSIWASPAFSAAHDDEIWTCAAMAVQLHRGLADSVAFSAGVSGIQPDALVLDSTAEALFVSRTTHLDAIILRLLAALAGVAGIMVLGQSLVRRTSVGAIDTPILRALGMTRREMVWAATLPGLVVAVAGSMIAVVGAVLASPLYPTGVVRVAEADPGVRIDPFAIGIGVAAIVVTTLASVVIPARWLATARGGVEGTVEYAGAERRSAIAAAIARLPLPVSVGAGARLALEPGHGRTATPVRSAVVGLGVAVAAMVAAFGFSASMDHFGSTPRLWGLDFDFGAGQPFMGAAFEKQAVPVIRDDPQVRDLAAGNFQQYLALEGPGGVSQEAVWALETVKGAPITTTMLAGRWPTAPDEVALGRETLSSLGVSVGDSVTATGAGTTRELRVVGVPVFPDVGFGPGLGRGAGMTMDGMRAFDPSITDNLVLGNVTPGARSSVVLSRLNDEVLRKLNAETRVGDIVRPGATVRGTLRSRALPLQLSALFAFAAFATLVHVLLTSVRRRRRDLAILETLGFRRSQLLATVAWQSLTLAALALLIGVPVGMLLGRLGWATFAYRLGVVSDPVISPLSVIVIPVTLVVALVVSLGPGLVARRVRPAAVLKAE